MKHIKSSSRKIDTVFIAALFTVFAATTLLVVLIAAKQYKLTAASMEDNYEVRTASSYLREVVSQNDASGCISVSDFSGSPALVFSSRVNDKNYFTYVYCYDGALRELYVSEDAQVTPESGQAIVDASSMTPELVSENLLHISYSDTDGSSHELYIALHSDAASVAEQEGP